MLKSFKPYEERLAAKKNQVKVGEPDFHEGEVVVIEQTALDIDTKALTSPIKLIHCNDCAAIADSSLPLQASARQIGRKFNLLPQIPQLP